MNSSKGKGLKTVRELIVEKHEKKRIKSERFMAKLEKEQQKKEKEKLSQPLNSSIPAQQGRKSTITIALPCSIINNAQSMELKFYVATLIARSAAIFQVDEIVVFNDTLEAVPENAGQFLDVKFNKHLHSAQLLTIILQYMECPPHLRKFFVPLKTANRLLPALEMNSLHLPHHNVDGTALYREGVVSNREVKAGEGSYVNVGLHHEVKVDRLLEQGIRVTVKMEPSKNENSKKLRGKLVSPSAPRLENNIYWGYSVRIANNLSQVLSGCPFGDKYDLTIGTSEKGTNVEEADLKSSSFKHALVVFGGLQGLEAVVEADEAITTSEPSQLFDLYLNTCPDQGSRTIRTEEAIYISLASLHSKFH